MRPDNHGFKGYQSSLRIFSMTVLVCSMKDACSALCETMWDLHLGTVPKQQVRRQSNSTTAAARRSLQSHGKPWSIHGIHVIHGHRIRCFGPNVCPNVNRRRFLVNVSKPFWSVAGWRFLLRESVSALQQLGVSHFCQRLRSLGNSDRILRGFRDILRLF